MLERAAETAVPLHGRAFSEPGYDRYVCRRTARIDFICTVTFAAVVVGITALVGLRTLVAEPTQAVALAAPGLVRPAPLAEPPPQAVKVVNPFDATEVFEFPPETTEAQARDAIAELLIQRAQERLDQGLNARRATPRRALPAANSPPEIFVTRLSGPVGQRIDPAGLGAVQGMAE